MAGLVYLNFDLTIEPSSSGPPHYRARSASLAAGEASAEFTLPFSEQDLEILFLRLGRPRRSVRAIGSPEMQAAQTFGCRLFTTVFSGQVQSAMASSLSLARQQGEGLRIRLHLSNAPELADLPWEFLYDPTPQNFLACSTITPLVRYLDLPNTIAPLTVQPPLKVLVMIANPRDYSYSTLNVEDEWRKVQAALADLLRRGLVQVTRLEAATLSALQRQLRQDQYHIFHFIGHGGFDQPSQSGALLLEDEQGRSRIVSGHHLSALLRDHPSVRLALLNACEGARASRTDPFAGVAQHLVQQGIPAVIAMQFEITDQAAIALSHEFYNALADNYGVDGALSEARKALYAAGNDIEWGTPVLYLRAQRSQLFDLATSLATPPEAASPSIRQVEPQQAAQSEPIISTPAPLAPVVTEFEPQLHPQSDYKPSPIIQSEAISTIARSVPMQPAQPLIENSVQPKPNLPLSAWNPLDYFKLLCWLFITPEQLQAYLTKDGKLDSFRLQPLGGNLTSILTWLPLLLPSVALWRDRLPSPIDAWPVTVYGWISFCLIVVVALGSWLDKYKNGVVSVMAFGVAFGVAGGVAGGVAFIVAFSVAGIVTGDLVVSIVPFVVVGLLVGVAFIVAFVVAGALSFVLIKHRDTVLWLAMGVAMIVSGVAGYLMGNVWVGVALVVAVALEFIIVFVLAAVVAYSIEDSVKKGITSWLSYGCFGALILTYVFLIWYCYLGGYEWLA